MVSSDASDRIAAFEPQQVDDEVVGWVFFGFSRPRRWVVAVSDFRKALGAAKGQRLLAPPLTLSQWIAAYGLDTDIWRNSDCQCRRRSSALSARLKG